MDAKLNIDFSVTPWLGIALPLLKLAEALVKRGHHVRVLDADFAMERLERFIPKGVEFVSLTTSYQSIEDFEKVPGRRDDPNALGFGVFPGYEEAISDALAKAISRPNVIVTGEWCFAARKLAQKENIPLVTNRDGDDFQKSLLDAAKETDAKPVLVLINTFFGIEQECELPSNVKLTGSLTTPTAMGLQGHDDIAAWVRKVGVPPIVVVSTGSVVELKEWQVQCLYNGLQATGLRVIWGMKNALQKFLPGVDKDKFWIGPWLPQTELLQEPAVAVFITHCGWGATLETIYAGKPVVTMPFFADQANNAALLVGKGLGEHLCEPPRDAKDDGSFSAEVVTRQVKKVAGERKYKEAAEKMQRAARASGGATAAAEWIEEVANPPPNDKK